ncbi:MAG: DUF2169 family type VI secretion system accessory protein [Solidesulfovibrio sp. DCME]|uniref:DUF2169 family type VI secretion system accessory protein n=1 Tax=Solidesulfovibrio sp. DCME TaxID=3447380 RepID=UPI003D098799
MKITKPRDLAFSVKPFALAGRPHVGLAAMAFFDLTAPKGLLTEQELWKAVPEALGPGGILDPGMPKPRGEVLVAGSACAPRGQTVTGLAVRVRLGALDKRLTVFGERFWLPGQAISPPRPFAAMPLTYGNAFGGPDFPANPTGKGLAATRLPDGRELVALPTVEAPDRLVAAPGDRPEPAGFGPLEITWPQRARYNGTYDERWKAERWPGMPDDTDYLLFNRAPADQWAGEFFRGDEAYALENMHPDLPVITGALPGLRARMFLTMRQGYKLYADPPTFPEAFVEVPARLETVWLFPTILRGLALYRGSVPNADDEARDIARAYLAWEKLTEAPETIEAYAEKMRRAQDLTVPIDLAPFQAAGKQLAQAVKQAKNAPKTLARTLAAVQGQTPVMPAGPQDVLGTARETAATGMATLDSLDGLVRGLQGRFGHLSAIDGGGIATLRAKLAGLVAGIETTAGQVTAAMGKAAAAKADLLKEANAALDEAPSAADLAARGFDPAALAKAGWDPNQRFTDKAGTGRPFHDAGFPFVVACRRALRADAPAREALRRLGLPDAVVNRAWLGINPEARDEPGEPWGLAQGPDGAPAPRVALPAGLVLPRFDGAHLTGLRLRPGAATGDFASPDGDVAVPGSDRAPLDLPPAEPGGHYVRAADPLQALFLEEEVGDACGVVALTAPTDKPGPDTAKAIAASGAFAVILPEGTSPTGEAWAAWKAAYAEAVPVILPKGATVFAARAAGVDIRALVMEALPKDFAARHVIEPSLPEPGKAPGAGFLPPLSLRSLGLGQAISGAMAKAKAEAAPLRAALEGMKQDLLRTAEPLLAKRNTTPEALLAPLQDSGSPKEACEDAMGQLLAKKRLLLEYDALPPEAAGQYDEAIARTRQTLDAAEARHKAGQSRIAAAKATFAAARDKIAARTIPGLSAADMAEAGLDPELGRIMTREQVIARHKDGLSFARRNLTGVDLSDLDLSGIDLSEAILRKTVFARSRLDGARLRKSLAMEADFSKASLAEADLTMAVLTGAKLRKARLAGATLRQTLLRRADLEKADLTGARLHLAVLSEAKLAKAKLGGASLTLTIVDAADLTKADCAGASLRKTVLRNLSLDRTDFTGADLVTLSLQKVTGRKVVFAGADMTKCNMGNGCRLAGTDFRKARLVGACLRETDVSGSDFRGAVLDRAMLELCDARGIVCNRVSAKRCSLIKTDLAGADLYGINLLLGSLRKSRLTEANLGRSNLYGVDFFNCVVGRTNFEGANMKRTLLAGKTDLLR